MPRKSTDEEGWWRFLDLCLETKKAKALNELLMLFMTFQERTDMGLRYELVKALLEGKRPQREIAEELGISIAKITRGSNALKIISEDLLEFLKTQMLR